MGSDPTVDGDVPLPTTEGETRSNGDVQETIDDSSAKQESTITDSQWLAFQELLQSILDHRLEDGHDPSHVFHRKVNKRLVPTYYEVIKEPIAFSTIRARVNLRQYKDVVEFVRDLTLIPHNAQVYNRPDAGAYQDALVIKGVLESELRTLVKRDLITVAQAELPYLGDIPDVEDAPLEERADEEEDDEDDEEEDADGDESDEDGSRRKVRKHRKAKTEKDEGEDANDGETLKKRRGRPPRVDTPMEARIKNILKGVRRLKNSEGQARIAPFERLPDKATMPEYYNEIKIPIAIDTIKKRVKRKKYHTVEQVLRDLDLMFENAKRYNEDGSEIFNDAVALQAEARKIAEEETQKPDTDYAMEDGRIPLPSGIMHNDETYKVGDWIHVQNPNDLTKPIVTQIYRTWQDSSGQKFVNACWYYRPEQTVHRFDKHFFSNEVVKTGQYRDHLVEEIVDRCFVMFVTRFSKGRPRGLPSDKAIYVCESRYNEEKHTFNKIKTWASCLPDEVRDKDYEMELFNEPRKMRKVPSPIAYLLKDEQKETDDFPKPQWGSDDAPPRIGAVHRRPKDPKDSPPPEPTPPPPPVRPTPPTIQAPRPSSGAAHTPGTYSQSRYNNLAPGTTSRNITSATITSLGAPMVQGRGFAQSAMPPLGRQPGGSRGSYSASTPQPNQQRAPALSNTNYGIGGGYGRGTNGTHVNAAIGANYQAPQPVEVYRLNDQQNFAITESVRAQFQCDDTGHVLFFTSPPLHIERMEKESLALGHSAKYLAAMKKRELDVNRKRKSDEDDEAHLTKARQRIARLAHRELQEEVGQIADRSKALWINQMREANDSLFKEVYGDRRAQIINQSPWLDVGAQPLTPPPLDQA